MRSAILGNDLKIHLVLVGVICPCLQTQIDFQHFLSWNEAEAGNISVSTIFICPDLGIYYFVVLLTAESRSWQYTTVIIQAWPAIPVCSATAGEFTREKE